MRSSRLIPAAVAIALLAAPQLIIPAAASAQVGNPFQPGVPQNGAPNVTTQAPPPVAQPTTTSTGGGGLSGGSAIAIGVGAVIVLAGISFFIWYDARRRAPVRQRMAEAAAGPAGSKPRPKPRKLSPAERRRRKRGRAR